MEDPGASDFDFTPNRLRQSLRQSVEGSVSKLPRRVIQGLAKDYGIKANLKSSDILRALYAKLVEQEADETDNCEEGEEEGAESSGPPAASAAGEGGAGLLSPVAEGDGRRYTPDQPQRASPPRLSPTPAKDLFGAVNPLFLAADGGREAGVDQEAPSSAAPCQPGQSSEQEGEQVAAERASGAPASDDQGGAGQLGPTAGVAPGGQAEAGACSSPPPEERPQVGGSAQAGSQEEVPQEAPQAGVAVEEPAEVQTGPEAEAAAAAAAPGPSSGQPGPVLQPSPFEVAAAEAEGVQPAAANAQPAPANPAAAAAKPAGPAPRRSLAGRRASAAAGCRSSIHKEWHGAQAQMLQELERSWSNVSAGSGKAQRSWKLPSASDVKLTASRLASSGFTVVNSPGKNPRPAAAAAATAAGGKRKAEGAPAHGGPAHKAARSSASPASQRSGAKAPTPSRLRTASGAGHARENAHANLHAGTKAVAHKPAASKPPNMPKPPALSMAERAKAAEAAFTARRVAALQKAQQKQ